jgi:hypothetical protein
MNKAIRHCPSGDKNLLEDRVEILLQALRRARAVLYIAMMDGTVKNTLWANSDENLLDYLDRKIATALDDALVERKQAESASGKLEAALWGLLGRPKALDPSTFFNEDKSSSSLRAAERIKG